MLYERIRYPDGQISAKIRDFTPPLEIKERINSYEDLIFVISIAEALRNQGFKNYHLDVPCLLGQRSDRRFMVQSSFDLKIITDLINNAKFLSVTILDPHSDTSLALINRSIKKSPFEHIRESVYREKSHLSVLAKLVLVSPDAGAYKKVYSTAEQLGLPLVAANKYRNLKGNIELQFSGDVAGCHCLIVDDLADGGYTFYKLAEELKHAGAARVALYVTHGMFFKGFDGLAEHIDHIYCTNSYRDIDHSMVTQFKVI